MEINEKKEPRKKPAVETIINKLYIIQFTLLTMIALFGFISCIFIFDRDDSENNKQINLEPEKKVEYTVYEGRELLNCPLCGGKGKLVSVSWDTGAYATCEDCHMLTDIYKCTTSMESLEQARKMWNTRVKE